MTENSDLSVAEETEAIVGLYLLFARLINEELSPELRDVLLQPEVLAVFAKAEPEVDKYLSGEWDDSDYEQASVAFCDALILPERSVQPRAVAWLTEGDPVSADGIHSVVEAFLNQNSITLPKEYVDLPYDHASVLFFVAATLRQAGHPQVGEFEEATLGTWIHVFGRTLKAGDSSLYRALGGLIEAT